METRKNHLMKKMLSVVVAVLILFMTIQTEAFARSESEFTWHQTLGEHVVDLGEMSPRQINVYFVATSPEKGTFKVRLERHSWLWFWDEVRTGYGGASQSSERHYDTRNHVMMYGDSNLLTWLVNKKGTYRIVMASPSTPQETVITRFESWSDNTK